MREILIGKIQQSFLAHFLSTSLQGASAAVEWRMANLPMFVAQMGSTIDHKMVAVAWDALYGTTS
jgi:hypothetical protein